jgi:hypothetical protein
MMRGNQPRRTGKQNFRLSKHSDPQRIAAIYFIVPNCRLPANTVSISLPNGGGEAPPCDWTGQGDLSIDPDYFSANQEQSSSNWKSRNGKDVNC